MRRGSSSASTSSTIRCSRARWITWIRPVSSDGTTIASSTSGASAPPPRPRKATVVTERVPGRARGGEQVRALAAGAVQHQQVARTAQRLHLPREDLLEAEVVAAAVSSEESVVSATAARGRRAAGVAHHVLGREVLRVGRAAAVAAEEQRPALPQRLGVAPRGRRHLLGQGRAVERGAGQRLEARLDRRGGHSPPSRRWRIFCIQLRRSSSGGTGVSGASSRMARGLTRVSRSACSAPSCDSRNCRPVADAPLVAVIVGREDVGQPGDHQRPRPLAAGLRREQGRGVHLHPRAESRASGRPPRAAAGVALGMGQQRDAARARPPAPARW